MKKRKIIFLDECGVNTNMTRYYGRAKGKKRVYDYVPAKKQSVQPCCHQSGLMERLHINFFRVH